MKAIANILAIGLFSATMIVCWTAVHAAVWPAEAVHLGSLLPPF